MTHWGWYWKHKKQHVAKGLCSWSRWNTIDSFEVFSRNIEGLGWVKRSAQKVLFEVFYPYKLKACLREDGGLDITSESGCYEIPVEKKPCNYGGHYYFFRCPNTKCSKRMRKLYCIKGIYLCRKCAKLGYFSQKVVSSRRNLEQSWKIEEYLKNRGGLLDKKPRGMHSSTFKRLLKKHDTYKYNYDISLHDEVWEWYGCCPKSSLHF